MTLKLRMFIHHKTALRVKGKYIYVYLPYTYVTKDCIQSIYLLKQMRKDVPLGKWAKDQNKNFKKMISKRSIK